ncbi:lantibiotic immunity ABC transporter MutG family permease subunit [Bacillus vallismortis]|uniref:lantibiotic immunity ABC transporter MutG family permease subunit n=1 Tax=Bacillus vallismortis TaxID=72361 RepID=UPI0002891925|nr:lantibiotic immunity ABC transporter MutG family permease subunit [Bacillus vallismortis]MBG9770287.1 SpaG [Bacillus vallismortis]MCY8426244.1 lantibiotic immunity ABC transporter MutG family permease subunit [Bacillus vallismortis]MCY8595567.1 lantibiotic immunity ABC transporter MutG family permease subunit [Bacillus vallismortis]MEC1267566.1 lantibiotic immunity ABC transporter MutG family permease subunit [Bacillus vallismortis]QAV07186.1 lantibiotic immunity ABC transporter MutG family
MRVLLRCLQADFQKTKHTSFMWLHFIIPIVCSCVLILYFYGRDQSQFHLYKSFMEAIGVALPLLIGVLCGMTATLEEQAGKFHVLLGSTAPKVIAYVSKLFMLLIMEVFSIGLALLIYFIGLKFILNVPDLSYDMFIMGGAWLVAGSVVLYCIYFFISCMFGMGASVLIGGAGLLMTALMNTGLGDAVWKYNPWAWGIRLSDLHGLLHFKEVNQGNHPLLMHEIHSGVLIMVFGIICTIIASLIWFSKWEGRKTFE